MSLFHVIKIVLTSCRVAGAVASEPVEPYFTRFLRVLSFCLGVSNGVFFCGNGVVNGVVGWAIMGMELHENKG